MWPMQTVMHTLLMWLMRTLTHVAAVRCCLQSIVHMVEGPLCPESLVEVVPSWAALPAPGSAG